MTSILFLKEAIYSNIFRCTYLRNGKTFSEFALNFRNLDSIFNILKQNMTLIADLFFNWRIPKNVVR